MVQKEFQSYYDAYSREVWAVAYGRGTNAETANGVLQETFLRLWREMCKGVEIREPRAWLIRVARNLAEDIARSAFSRNGTTEPGLMDQVKSRTEQPEYVVLEKELHGQIREGMQELTTQDREILTMRYSMDYEIPQIAKALGLHASAVHMRLSRARAKLAECLNQKGIHTAGI